MRFSLSWRRNRSSWHRKLPTNRGYSAPVAYIMAQLKLLTGSSEPLTGEDAERLIAYIEKPTMPEGHDEYLNKADQTFSEIRPRPDTSS